MDSHSSLSFPRVEIHKESFTIGETTPCYRPLIKRRLTNSVWASYGKFNERNKRIRQMLPENHSPLAHFKSISPGIATFTANTLPPFKLHRSLSFYCVRASSLGTIKKELHFHSSIGGNFHSTIVLGARILRYQFFFYTLIIIHLLSRTIL